MQDTSKIKQEAAKIWPTERMIKNLHKGEFH